MVSNLFVPLSLCSLLTRSIWRNLCRVSREQVGETNTQGVGAGAGVGAGEGPGAVVRTAGGAEVRQGVGVEAGIGVGSL